MPRFIYTARNPEGKTTGGEIVARDEKTAAQQIRADGYLVTSLKQLDEKKTDVKVKFLDRFLKVPLKDKMIFARNLSVMIASGLPISRAIHNLSFQTKNKRFQKILKDIHEEIQKGRGLSDGLAKYPSVLSELFVNMVKVGETGGNLDEILEILLDESPYTSLGPFSSTSF